MFSRIHRDVRAIKSKSRGHKTMNFDIELTGPLTPGDQTSPTANFTGNPGDVVLVLCRAYLHNIVNDGGNPSAQLRVSVSSGSGVLAIHDLNVSIGNWTDFIVIPVIFDVGYQAIISVTPISLVSDQIDGLQGTWSVRFALK